MDASEQHEDEQPLEEDDEELERAIPPVLYTCIHKGDSAHCEFWDLHIQDPDYYDYVDDGTPCHFCGHRGTLRIYV